MPTTAYAITVKPPVEHGYYVPVQVSFELASAPGATPNRNPAYATLNGTTPLDTTTISDATTFYFESASAVNVKCSLQGDDDAGGAWSLVPLAYASPAVVTCQPASGGVQAPELTSQYVAISVTGAVGDGTTNDTAVIQAALDACDAAGGGVVNLGRGTFLVSSLTIGSRTTLSGTGPSTVLKQAASTTGAVIGLDATSSQGVTIRRLLIDGNKANQSASNAGISLENQTTGISPSAFGTGTTSDAHHTVEDVMIFKCKGNGLTLSGRGETRISRVLAYSCGGDGFYVAGIDSYFVSCVAGDNTGYGFRNTDPAAGGGGGSNGYTNCKAFLNVLDGFYIYNAQSVRLDACHSQANYRYGYRIEANYGCVISDCVAQDNDWGGTSTYTGFRIEGAGTNHRITGVASNVQGVGTKQIAAISFGASALGNSVDLTSATTTMAQGDVADTTVLYGNSVRINGRDLTPPAPAPKFLSGRYYVHPQGVASTGNYTLNTMRLTPFWVYETTAFDRIAVEVTSAGTAGSIIRLGVYTSDESFRPKTLAFEASGTVDGTSATAQELTISQTLYPGLYWLASVAQVAICTVRTSNGPGMWIGAATLSGIQFDLSGWTYPSVSGALPSPLTAASLSQSTNAVRVALRAT